MQLKLEGSPPPGLRVKTAAWNCPPSRAHSILVLLHPLATFLAAGHQRKIHRRTIACPPPPAGYGGQGKRPRKCPRPRLTRASNSSSSASASCCQREDWSRKMSSPQRRGSVASLDRTFGAGPGFAPLPGLRRAAPAATSGVVHVQGEAVAAREMGLLGWARAIW